MMLFEIFLHQLESQPVFKEDVLLVEQKRNQLETIARAEERAVSRVRWPGPPRELGSLLNAVLGSETHASLRIHAGECRRLECDRGRARGLWQQHASRFISQEAYEKLAGLEQENTDVAAHEAAKALARARASCRQYESDHDWVRMTLSHYAGRGCFGAFRGIEIRVKEFRRLETIR